MPNFVYQRKSGRDAGLFQVQFSVPSSCAEQYEGTLNAIADILRHRRAGRQPTKFQIHAEAAEHYLKFLLTQETED
jgi:hypothetical protein